MHVALGCDHRGLILKQSIMNLLAETGHSYQDFGCYDASPVDYPDVAWEVAGGVARGEFDCGILLCSTGIGMSIAANKVKGARAALCWDTFGASRARQHNDANIICPGTDVLNGGLVLDIVKTYLATEFEGGRHQVRLEKIKAMERLLDYK